MGMKVSGLDACMLKLGRYSGELDEAAKKALKAGGKMLREAYEKRLHEQNVSGQSKHELEKSIKVSPPKFDVANGWHVKVYPDGYDSKGEPFPLIANVLEYGRGSKARGMYPWMAPTNELIGGEIVERMKGKFKEETEHE